MVTVKMGWVVRATSIVTDHVMHEEFGTRADARHYKGVLKGMKAWGDIQMYRMNELRYECGRIVMVMEKAR